MFTSSCIWVAGGQDDVEILTGIASRLGDQDSSHVVQMLHEEPHNIHMIFTLFPQKSPPLLGDGCPGHRGAARDKHTGRLSAAVDVNTFEH